jgi:hypothetical protein
MMATELSGFPPKSMGARLDASPADIMVRSSSCSIDGTNRFLVRAVMALAPFAEQTQPGDVQAGVISG